MLSVLAQRSGEADRPGRASADDPRPPGCKKLVGVDAWRIRVDDWRIVYSIADDVLTVLVLRVGHGLSGLGLIRLDDGFRRLLAGFVRLVRA